MKEIVVLSGKGGTGKTSFATSLFARLPNAVMADCDVDAPDSHILLKPENLESEDFVGARKAVVDPGLCRNGEGCGGRFTCASSCRFEAISVNSGEHGCDAPLPSVRNSRCEGCGVCLKVCPADAISLENTVVGRIGRGDTLWGPLIHARLKPGEETSGKLVAEVRRRGRRAAEDISASYLVIDGSPGIGCPVISSLTGADLALLVTEPSLSALRDLERLNALLRQFRIPAMIVINKWDISATLTGRIEAFCEEADIPVGMRLPYDNRIPAAIVDRRIPSIAEADFYKTNGFEALLDRLF